jgi:hypothetical protein
MAEKRGKNGIGRFLSLAPASALLVSLIAVAGSANGQSAEAPMALPVPDILRGSVAPPPPAIEPAAGPAAPTPIAGERLWLVDQDRRKLIGCRLVNTSQVGGQYIRCTERRLPRDARPYDR